VIYILQPTLSENTFFTHHFLDIHFSPNTFVICNSTPDSWNSQASIYPGSQKFQNIYHPLQSPQHSCPFQCTFIMILLGKTQHASLLIGINKKKTNSTAIYGSLADPRVGTIINLAPKTFSIYNSAIYILHQNFSCSKIPPQIETWFTFGPQIIY
jgi:hypothetical protein